MQIILGVRWISASSDDVIVKRANVLLFDYRQAGVFSCITFRCLGARRDFPGNELNTITTIFECTEWYERKIKCFVTQLWDFSCFRQVSAYYLARFIWSRLESEVSGLARRPIRGRDGRCCQQDVWVVTCLARQVKTRETGGRCSFRGINSI